MQAKADEVKDIALQNLDRLLERQGKYVLGIPLQCSFFFFFYNADIPFFLNSLGSKRRSMPPRG